MGLSETGKRLAKESYLRRADEINRQAQARVEAARRANAGNLNAATFPAEVERLSAARLEQLTLAWADSFIAAAEAEHTFLSAADVESILRTAESMATACVGSAVDALHRTGALTGHYRTGVDVDRARDAALSKCKRRLLATRLRYSVIKDRVELVRQTVRKQAEDRVPLIVSDYANRGLAISSGVADAHYRHYLTAVESVAGEYSLAEETEPLDVSKISEEAWLSESGSNIRELLDTEFDWLGSRMAGLLAGSLAALPTLQKQLQEKADRDRARIAAMLEARLRVFANRSLGNQKRSDSASLPTAQLSWPIATPPPGPSEQADGLAMLFKKDLLDSSLESAAAFASERQLPFSVLMLDIDHFKGVNDKYGHQKGDEVLAAVANVLCLTLIGKGRPYRCGGEEMCAIIPNASQDEAVTLAERIRRAVEDIRIDGIEAPTTVSIGLAVFPTNGRDTKELLGRADAALYKAKAAGRNCVVAATE